MVTTSVINRLSQAIDQIEQRTQQKPWKTVQVLRDWHEHGDVAVDRHMAAHPEDLDADVVVFYFCNIKTEGETQASAGPATRTRV
jgi:hypothetical protein